MDFTLLSRRPAIRVMGVLLALIAIYFAVRAYRATARMEHDFPTYYLSSLDARTGENAYRDRAKQSPFIYPPLLLWLLTPLTFFGPQPMAVVWAWVTLLAWAAVVVLANDALQKLMPPTEGEDRSAFLWIPTLLAFRPLWRELGMGNVNLVVVAAVTVGFWALVKRRDVLAGAAIAFAAVLKILPITFFLPLLVWRRWKALAVAALMIPGWFLLPAVTYGPARHVEILGQFLHGRLFHHATDLSMDNHLWNQSLPATVNRWLTPTPAFPLGHDLHGRQINVASFTLGQTAVAMGIVGLLLAALTAFAIWRSAHLPEMMGLSFALVWCFTHLMSKKTWEEHLVSLLFVYTALLVGPPAWRRAGATAVVISGLLSWSGTSMIWGRYGADLWQVYGPSTLALLVLWVHLFRRLTVAAPQPARSANVETTGAALQPALA